MGLKSWNLDKPGHQVCRLFFPSTRVCALLTPKLVS